MHTWRWLLFLVVALLQSHAEPIANVTKFIFLRRMRKVRQLRTKGEVDADLTRAWAVT